MHLHGNTHVPFESTKNTVLRHLVRTKSVSMKSQKESIGIS